jgi:hypothetical protein
MELSLKRVIFTEKSTEGRLSVDGAFECFTIERPTLGGSNEPEVSAILPGRYAIKMAFSPHFAKDMMHLQDVPGRTDVMIHNANWAWQLKGCIAVGQTQTPDFVGNSVTALALLTAKVVRALADGEVWLTIA